jgi:crossover junction endodeoxyribonuclease RuvC
MVILGVDPGTKITGYGVIDFGKNKFKRLANGCIKLPSNEQLPKKLEMIYNELVKLIRTYKPDELAIETAFYGKNVQSALKIGYARGVSLLAAIQNKVPASEYSPGEIKKAVAGNGSASKEQVSYMVKAILNLKRTEFSPDESDALAIAICHAFRLKIPSLKKNNGWKDYIEAYPEKVSNP